MRGLAAYARAHRRHEDAGGGEERQVALQLAVNHGRESAELVEHGEEGFKHAVDSEEGVGQRHAAYHRTEHVTLVPLLAGQIRHHRQVTAQNDLEAAHTLAGAGIHLVRHG